MGEEMSLLRTPYSHSRVRDEEARERHHQEVQLLLCRTPMEDGAPKRRSFFRLRVQRLKVRIGRRLTGMKKSMQFTMSKVKVWTKVQATGRIKRLKGPSSGTGTSNSLLQFC